MKARELCEKAWQEIASHFLDFKITKKGQTLKKFLKMKTLLLKFIFKLVDMIILAVLNLVCIFQHILNQWQRLI